VDADPQSAFQIHRLESLELSDRIKAVEQSNLLLKKRLAALELQVFKLEAERMTPCASLRKEHRLSPQKRSLRLGAR
jgi:hypothetical protein